MLHENDQSNTKKLIPKEGQLRISCSNEVLKSCPSFDINNQEEVETEIAQKLSAILFDKYVIWKQKQKTHTNTEE